MSIINETVKYWCVVHSHPAPPSTLITHTHTHTHTHCYVSSDEKRIASSK